MRMPEEDKARSPEKNFNLTEYIQFDSPNQVIDDSRQIRRYNSLVRLLIPGDYTICAAITILPQEGKLPGKIIVGTNPHKKSQKLKRKYENLKQELSKELHKTKHKLEEKYKIANKNIDYNGTINQLKLEIEEINQEILSLPSYSHKKFSLLNRENQNQKNSIINSVKDKLKIISDFVKKIKETKGNQFYDTDLLKNTAYTLQKKGGIVQEDSSSSYDIKRICKDLDKLAKSIWSVKDKYFDKNIHENNSLNIISKTILEEGEIEEKKEIEKEGEIETYLDKQDIVEDENTDVSNLSPEEINCLIDESTEIEVIVGSWEKGHEHGEVLIAEKILELVSAENPDPRVRQESAVGVTKLCCQTCYPTLQVYNEDLIKIKKGYHIEVAGSSGNLFTNANVNKNLINKIKAQEGNNIEGIKKLDKPLLKNQQHIYYNNVSNYYKVAYQDMDNSKKRKGVLDDSFDNLQETLTKNKGVVSPNDVKKIKRESSPPLISDNQLKQVIKELQKQSIFTKLVPNSGIVPQKSSSNQKNDRRDKKDFSRQNTCFNFRNNPRTKNNREWK